MSKPIEIDQEIAEGETYSDGATSLKTTVAALQVGTDADVDVHLDARVGGSMSWVEDFIDTRTVGAGEVILRLIDIEATPQIRVRIENIDTAPANVKAVLKTR